MRTVWKFDIMDSRGVQEASTPMPYGAKALSVGMQDGNVCLWAEVSDSAPLIPYELVVCGTGYPIPFELLYIGTAFDGGFVWHVYGEPRLVR